MFITGGTGSIGSELAYQALAAGWNVIIQGSRDTSVNELVRKLQDTHQNARVSGVAADIKNTGAVEQMLEAAATEFGRLDAIVDCLVTGPDQGGIVGPLEHTNPNAFLPFAELSIVYLERLAFSALPWLKKSSGCLLSLVSDAGLFPAPRQAIIGAARAAAISFIKNIAIELAHDGVRANCISLSFVAGSNSFKKLSASGAERIEKARKRAGLGLPTPSDIAPLALFLCGHGAQRITGQVISLNGGLNV